DDTGRPYFTGYAYKTLYDWDQYFEAIIQAYMGWSSEYVVNAITIFLDHQLESGHIARSVPGGEWHDPEHVKPFLCQTAVVVKRFYDDLSWLNEDYMGKLKKYLDYWLNDMDSTGNGLSEWMSAPHTGMDNQHERAGWWHDRMSKGVDLNCYLVRECQAYALLAGARGLEDQQKLYNQIAEERAEKIRTEMWNEEDGFFYDIHVKTGKQIPVKNAGAFGVLWANVASREQAERLVVENLVNPREFWSEYPVATLAKSEFGYKPRLQTRGENIDMFDGKVKEGKPENVWNDLGCNWRANTWMPTNYMICHGLKDYGYDILAKAMVYQTGKLMEKSGNREYYLSDTGEGCGLDPFWGWSLLGHFFSYEESCGYDITKLNLDSIEAK
ncbi:MAG: trehalase family glycosidase, partial [Spirochaetales bacterium]|nr:trehalase family glycosidase [Spirochaetales bacterium]